jgi:hypothetical protein
MMQRLMVEPCNVNTCELCGRDYRGRLCRFRCPECFASSPWKVKIEGYWRRWWWASDPRWWSLWGIGTRFSVWRAFRGVAR